MEAIAKSRYLRVSARKIRLVVDEVRGYPFKEASDHLKYMKPKGAEFVLKTLHSAVANAKIVSPEIDEKDLYIKKIYVDKGIMFKRFTPRARGRGSRILKRTSNLTIVLSDDK